MAEQQRMIEINNVSKWYGPVQVLQDCSVTINKGDVVVVCGKSTGSMLRNACGRTTSFMFCAYVMPTACPA